jgi:hypothetical protein
LIVAAAALVVLISCEKKSTGPEGPTRPVAPTQLSIVSVDTTTVLLSWHDNSNNEEGFRVYMASGGQWTLKGTLAVDSTRYLAANLWSGAEYDFRVSAYNGVGESDFSNTVTISTTGIPLAPQNLTAQTWSHNQIKLHWTDVSEGELGFVVQRHTETDDFVTIATTVPNDTAYSDSNLTPETLYYYRVGALGQMSTRWSLTDTTRTWLAAVPDAPSGLVTAVVMGSGIRLTWQDNSFNELFFLIYRSDDGATYKRTDSLVANTTTFVDGRIEQYHRYGYRVYAGNTLGLSDASNEAFAYYDYGSAGLIPLVKDNLWYYKTHAGGQSYEIRTQVLRVEFFGTSPWFLIQEWNANTGEVDTTTFMRNYDNMGVFYREPPANSYLAWMYPTVVGEHYFVGEDCVRVFAVKDTAQVPAGDFGSVYGYRRFTSSGDSVDTFIEANVGIIRVRAYEGVAVASEQVLMQYTILGP